MAFAGLMFGASPVQINSVVNAGDYSARLCPGCDVSIFGVNFTSDATVTVGGQAAYVIFNSSTQLNVQFPYSISAGSSTMTVTQVSGAASASVNILSYAPAFAGTPAVFGTGGGGVGIADARPAVQGLSPHPGIGLGGGPSPISVANPAAAGQTLSAYLYGLGATNPAAPLGPTATSQSYLTAATPVVMLTPSSGGSGTAAVVAFSGLAPGLTGQYQINFTVPAGLNPGMYTLTVAIGGFTSNTYQIPVASSAASTAVNISNPANLGVWTIGGIVIPLNATGGNGIYTWSVTSGSLPPGLALRTDLQNLANGAQAAIAGVPPAAAVPSHNVYNFTLGVSSGGNQNSQAETLTVTSLVAKDNYALPDSFSGVPYSYTFTPEGNTGTVVFNTGSTTGIPTGMSLSSTGTLSTNAGATVAAGNYSIQLSFTDQTTGDTCFRTYNLSVYNLRFTSPGLLPNATQNGAYSYTLAAAGGDGNYTFSGGAPSGLSLSSSGAITGNANFFGKQSFSVTVGDGSFGSYNKQFTIDSVSTPAALPSIYVYGSLSDCTFGGPCQQGFGVAAGTAPYTWTVTGLPAGMDYTTGANATPGSLAPGDVEIWGTALAGGTFNVSVTVTDANNNSATQIFPLHVSNLSLYRNGLPNGTLGAQYNGTASGYPFQVLGGSASYTASLISGALPNGLTLSGLAVSGTPLESGGFSTLFTFTDTTTPTANTLTLGEGPYINGPANSTIQINSSFLGTYSPGQSISQTLNACCAPGPAWTALTPLPTGINLSTTGVVTGSVTAPGTYSFLVMATSTSDSTNYAARLISFTISPMVIVPPNNSTVLPYGNISNTVQYSQTLTTSGNVGAVTWSLPVANYLPPGLSLGVSTGTISGLPSASGQYYFTVTATDSANNTASINLSIAIYPAGANPPVFITNNANIGTWSIGDDEYELDATGGNGAYTWNLTSGSLPPGISLRTDFPTYFSSNASAGLIGVATTPGTYTFTLTAASQGAQSASLTFTWKITGFALKDTYSMPDAFVGHAYSYQLTTLNAPLGSTISFGQCGTNSYSLPAGLTLSSSGLISGTPTVAGFYNQISFSYSDGTDTLCRGINLRVGAILITTTGPATGLLPNAIQNTAYSTTVSATGGSGTYTWSANLPSGWSITPGPSASATISATNNQGPGRYAFSITATDANNASYSMATAVDIVGLPPALAEITPYGNLDACTFGTPCDRGIAVINGGTAPFTWSVTGLPSGMGFRSGSGVASSGYTPTDLDLWGTPTQTGNFPITVTVTDSSTSPVSVKAAFSLFVGVILVDNGLPNGTINTAYSSTLRVVGGTPPYSASPFTGALPFGLVTSSAASGSGITISGTPQEDGSFSEDLVIIDSASHGTGYTANLFINGPTSTMITVNNGYLGVFQVNQQLNYTLTACCTTSNSFTWTATNPPAWLSLSTAGLLSGTPPSSGNFAFLVKATDTSNSANYGMRLITLTVSPLSITNNASLPYGNVGTQYSQTLTATGSSNALSWSVMLNNYLPPGFTLSSGGVLASGSGGPASPGQYYFGITVTDTVTNFIAQRYFTLNIYPAGGVPPVVITNNANLGTFSIGEIQTQLNATGGINV